MRIKKIKIRNFYSIEDLEVDLENYKGITLIDGFNKDAGGSNGSGKSSILEAICWGLTGKTIRKSNEIALVNNKNKKRCFVEILFSDNKIIRRQKKPTFLEFFVGDKNYTKESVPATQQEIERNLGFSYKSLLCTSFFGQHNGFDFLDATPEDKRNIINNFLNLEDIFDKRKIVKDLKSTHYQEAKAQLSVIKEYSRSISDIEEQQSTLQELAKEYENKYDETVLNLSLEDILELEKRRERVSTDLAVAKNQLFKLATRHKELESKINNPHKETLCTTCFQALPESPPEELQNSLLLCLNSIGTFEAKVQSLEAHQVTAPVISSSEYAKIQEYHGLLRDVEKYDEFKKELQQKIAICESKREHQDLMYEVMKFWEKAFSEQGVVKYIIRNVLGYFNDKCNYYLAYLCDNNYVMDFDEELTEKITSRGLEVQYISLSGGEKRKVNLAVLMALKDLFVLNDSYDSDILFFDEIAENLDENGINGLFSLLQEIKKDKDIFVITHNKYLRSNLDSANTITIIKEEGNSRIKEQDGAN